MSKEIMSTANLLRKIGSISADVQNVLRNEKGEEYSRQTIEESMQQCLDFKLDEIEENMHEMFTSPATPEFDQLSVVLERSKLEERAVELSESVATADQLGEETVFSGRRGFDKDKMAAMIEYLTAKGNHVYKTSLNKLLFYSDLTNYYLSGQGISGAVYLNRPYGPVAGPTESILIELIDKETVRVDSRMETLKGSGDGDNILSADEKKVLDWVSATYGKMSAGAISEFSHREMAYKFTDPNEPIAYEYAKFFKTLPPSSILTRA